MKRIFALGFLLVFLLAGCRNVRSSSLEKRDHDTSSGSGWFSSLLEDLVSEQEPADGSPEDENSKTEATEDVETPRSTADEDWETVSTTASATAANSRQSEALEEAWSYLSALSFSHEGLVEQLEYEGYSHDEAVYAADHCGADWYAEAVEAAASYLKNMSFSRAELIDQLEYEGFTYEQAVHGVDAVYEQSGSSGVSASKQNALESARSYLRYSSFSYEGLVEQLEYEGYPKEDAKYAADNCGADWYAEAVEAAESYLKYMSFSRSELLDQLRFEGFTYDQAVYGVEQNGL